jgi:hypothetical protein
LYSIEQEQFQRLDEYCVQVVLSFPLEGKVLVLRYNKGGWDIVLNFSARNVVVSGTNEIKSLGIIKASVSIIPQFCLFFFFLCCIKVLVL